MAAGSVVQTLISFMRGEKRIKQIALACTGGTAGDAGTIPDTDVESSIMNVIKGMRLERVDAFPTNGGTAPDEADVFLLEDQEVGATQLDLLGCIDGSTTAYNGLKLIHATLPRRTYPSNYVPRAGEQYPDKPVITGQLALKVANQATESANWTVVLTFIP